MAALDLVDDKAGKPVGIEQVIGRLPTIAFGNSDGDFEMLEWTTTAPGPRLGVIVHHTDAEREWAYDREGRPSDASCVVWMKRTGAAGWSQTWSRIGRGSSRKGCDERQKTASEASAVIRPGG